MGACIPERPSPDPSHHHHRLSESPGATRQARRRNGDRLTMHPEHVRPDVPAGAVPPLSGDVPEAVGLITRLTPFLAPRGARS